MTYYIFDGQIVNDTEIILTEEFTDDRIRLIQKIWYGYGGIPLFSENIHQLETQASHLNIPLPQLFDDKRELFRLIKRMLNKNKYYRSGHILLQILTDGNSVCSIVTCNAYRGFSFPFSEEGALVKFSNLKKYSGNTCNRFTFFNERLWQSALAEFRGTQYQQAIILNENDFVCECAFASLFMMAENELIYPSLQSGCHENVILPVILDAAVKLGLKVTERAFISKEGLLSADELFCVSEIRGMNWILGIENQRFIHYFSRKINDELNALLKQKAASYVLS